MAGSRVQNKFSWERAIAESDLPATSRLVAFTLGLHFSKIGDSCWPSMDTVARESGLDRSTVVRHLAALRQAGWIACVHRGGSPEGGQRTSNHYAATIPAHQLPFDTSSTGLPVAEGNGSHSVEPPIVLSPATGGPVRPKQSLTTTEQHGEELSFEEGLAHLRAMPNRSKVRPG